MTVYEEQDPAKLRDYRINNIVEIAMKSLSERGLPTNLYSYREYLARVCRDIFYTIDWTESFHVAEVASDISLRKFKLQNSSEAL